VPSTARIEKLSERPVTFESAGTRLCGILGEPAKPAEHGVLLIHGWTGYRIGPHRILVHVARRLAEEGFATLRFDLRGRGDSEGCGPAVCLDDMIEDALAAADCLSREANVSRITLLGICSGSNVAIGAATLRPDIDELVLWSTLPFQPDQGAHQRVGRARFYLAQYARKALRLETWRRLFRGDVNVRMVGRTIAGDSAPARGERNLKDSARDIMAAFADYRGRALFVTGAKDPEGMEGRRLFEEFTREKDINATFHLIDGATHSYYAQAHEKEVIDVTSQWLSAPGT